MSESPPDLFRGSLLRLAAARAEDALSFSRWSEDAEYRRQLDSSFARPEPPDAFARTHNAGSHSVYFALRTIADDRLVGFIAVHDIEWNNGSGILSIGIGDREYRDRGYGSEALRLMLRFVFDELNLHRIGLDVHGDNPRAIRVYERAGFRHEGALREALHRDGRRHDRLLMGLLRDEWEERGGRP